MIVLRWLWKIVSNFLLIVGLTGLALLGVWVFWAIIDTMHYAFGGN